MVVAELGSSVRIGPHIELSASGDVIRGHIHRIQPAIAGPLIQEIMRVDEFPIDRIVRRGGLVDGTPPQIQGKTWGPMQHVQDIWAMQSDTLFIATNPGVEDDILEARHAVRAPRLDEWKVMADRLPIGIVIVHTVHAPREDTATHTVSAWIRPSSVAQSFTRQRVPEQVLTISQKCQ